MSYRVEFSGEFQDNVREQVEYMRSQHVSEGHIEQWFGRLFNQLDTLRESPRRHPTDPIQSEAIGEPSHKLVYGKYLVLYRVDDAQQRVSVDVFIHGARERTRDIALEKTRGRSIEHDPNDRGR